MGRKIKLFLRRKKKGIDLNQMVSSNLIQKMTLEELNSPQ